MSQFLYFISHNVVNKQQINYCLDMVASCVILVVLIGDIHERYTSTCTLRRLLPYIVGTAGDALFLLCP
jgi:hypothetical protein